MSSPTTLVMAHRGFHRDVRENTVEAFRAAVACGVDGVELDVRRTRDGVLVVHHDPDVDGLAIADLAAADLPTWVPTLETAIAATGHVLVNVEIKNITLEDHYDHSGDFAREVVATLSDLDVLARCQISCFDLATCSEVKATAPRLNVAWLLWKVDPQAALTQAHVLGLDAINPHFSAVTPAVWERASELGIACNVWTVNEPAEMTRLFDAEVASLITDAPDLALAVRAERGFATGQ